MEYYNIDVRLYGSNDHIVCKNSVSVAEMEVYRLIHGADACTNIRFAGTKKDVNLAALRQTLEKKFPRYAEQIRKELFPGAHPRMPLKIQDIGFVKEGEKFRVFEPDRDGLKTGKVESNDFDVVQPPTTGEVAARLNAALTAPAQPAHAASQALNAFPLIQNTPAMLPPVLAGADEGDDNDGFNVDFEGAEKPQPFAAKG